LVLAVREVERRFKSSNERTSPAVPPELPDCTPVPPFISLSLSLSLLSPGDKIAVCSLLFKMHSAGVYKWKKEEGGLRKVFFFVFSFFGFSQLASRMPKGRSNRRILAHCQIGGDNLVAGEEAGGKSARMLVACLHFSADFPNR